MNKINKIDQKIINTTVKQKLSEENIQFLNKNEEIEFIKTRPFALTGTTYKIKPSESVHAYYITVNTFENEPFELFITSKDTENYQWVAAIARLVSAIFRKGGDYKFITEEFRQIAAPHGGYWGKDHETGKGVFYSSLIAEIGAVLQYHFKLQSNEPALTIYNAPPLEEKPESSDFLTQEELQGFIKGKVCKKCNKASVVKLDGCDTCLECGDSKCG